MNFRVKKFTIKNTQKRKEKKTLIFETIISLIPWNDKLQFFEIDAIHGDVRILQLLPQVLIL
jgi:hypothetical protein